MYVLFCIGEVNIETVCVLAVALMILGFPLTLWRLNNAYFHFLVSIYDLEHGSKSEVSVFLLVYCVVQTLLQKHKKEKNFSV
jgi:hypothetical protein